MRKTYLVGMLFINFLFLGNLQAQKTLIYSLTENPTETLIVSLLELGFENSHNSQRYQLQANRDPVNEARKIQMLKDGQLDIVWMGTQKQYEDELYPIRIPILKGMLGHRIFIIRQGEQASFNAISSFENLRSIPVGQGKFWGDTGVLKHAGMNVVDPVKYESLFHMLEGGRFDYFPRALHEPWSEVANRGELNLTIEARHLLIYPFALYFFVSKDNQALGELIHDGLRRAIDKGSYDTAFYQHPVIKETLQRSKLAKRIVHRLDNPNMSHLTPVHDKSLWLDIQNF
ncbi:MAG: diguanylate cyclase [Aestuariibacter sp.]